MAGATSGAKRGLDPDATPGAPRPPPPLPLPLQTAPPPTPMPRRPYPRAVQDEITVRIVPGSEGERGPGPLLSALMDRDGDFDFCMTNPPFFATEEEVRSLERREEMWTGLAGQGGGGTRRDLGRVVYRGWSLPLAGSYQIGGLAGWWGSSEAAFLATGRDRLRFLVMSEMWRIWNKLGVNGGRGGGRRKRRR